MLAEPMAPPVAADPLEGAPTVERLKRMLDAYRSGTDANARLQRLDRDYFDGHGQLNADVRKVLRDRRQPEIYSNRIRPTINGMLGVLSAAATSPRALPRNPHGEQEKAADVVTKTLRFIAESNGFESTKLDCAEEFKIEGTGACIIEVVDDEITITQIPQSDYFHDPLSRRADFTDAKYQGAAKWMYAADVKLMYPERYKALGDPVGGACIADLTKSDEAIENTMGWVDAKDHRLMIVEVYYREEGDWFR